MFEEDSSAPSVTFIDEIQQVTAQSIITVEKWYRNKET
jgi:hypothetical protein